MVEGSLISGKTKICGIIGDPIEHTMSPVMHNAAFKELGIDGWYLPFRVRAADLAEAIGGLRALNIRGLNVTIPHKTAVIPFLDKLDSSVERIDAVNTIVNDGGVLTGYNTDVAGFLQALLEKGIEPAGKNVVILGAGGAAKGISFILAERGAHPVILNRHLDRAEELARRIIRALKQEIKARSLSEVNLAAALAKADILVNTTSVGMVPGVEDTPVPAKLLRSGLVVFDIVYNPIKTRLLREAEAAGARTIDGLYMLVWQGALAFEKWTGRKPPVNLMRKEAIKALGYED
ncbi:MAG: shikimate dehydrogenase [Dehalococcoidales bacterium]|nr:shikimate dehydrogenase [Dehalococcoidales bacterium]